MSIKTRKRVREEEILPITTEKRVRNEDNEEQNIEVEFGGLSEELLGNGNTEVFSTLIPLMRNVCVLKTCRLVCKSWNQFACRALRKHSEVFYYVDEDFPDETETQLKLITENVHLRLPSPFRIFEVHVTDLKEEHILKFLKYLRETTSDFLLDLSIYSYQVDQAELQTVLTCNQNNLKTIKLTLDGEAIDQDDYGRNENLIQSELIRLPYLKTFRISNYNLTQEEVTLCENICRYSPLQSVTITSHGLGEELKKVMTSLSTKSVEELCFNFSERLSLDDWEFIKTRLFKIQGIKKLSIYHPSASILLGASYYDTFETIISHFAGSLESLAGDYLPRLNDKCFPKLREITGAPFDFDFYQPVECYPLLRKATFVVGCNDMFRDITDEPNLAIQQLSFKFVTDVDSLSKVISLAGWRFPNVSNFGGDFSDEIQFTSEMLGVICESFPKLTALELRVNLAIQDDQTLSGLRGNFVDWLHKGWPLERIPRAPSLLNFSELEKLTLGPHVLVTTNLFFYCLSKIPKLKYLTFYLNGEVSAIDVRDSVGHLTRIRVIVSESFNPIQPEWEEEMERLRIMLPAVVEIKKIHNWQK